MKKINFKLNSGYTIIELMISISLFLVIIISGMGALLSASALHQKSEAMSSIMDSLSFVIEDMSRNLRTGYDYRCLTGSDTLSNVAVALSGSSCWGIAFETASGDPTTSSDQWVYEIVTQNGGSTYYIRKSVDGGATWVQLTPDQVVINSVASSFSVLGAEPPSNSTSKEPLQTPPVYGQQQPLVTIRLVGTITVQGVVTPFSLQTSVSQRLLNV